MIVTTYFANLRNLPENFIPVSICGKAPKWYKGIQYKKLAPKYEFFMKWKENHDNDYYTKCFQEQVLNTLKPTEVVRELMELVGAKNIALDIALVCYEKPDEFCHRHLVSNWLNDYGYSVQEFVKGEIMSEFDSGWVQDENWDELVCEECKTCKFYQNQQRYCEGDEQPCKDRVVI